MPPRKNDDDAANNASQVPRSRQPRANAKGWAQISGTTPEKKDAMSYQGTATRRIVKLRHNPETKMMGQ